ncbi:MAG: hypothetical protein P8M30_05700 [Planctomycetaceae bacterium]|jgi:hypothetical protein|nr:hypothetical protein [bacterium]MDG2388797.1 hypothetical protein [Planctomycetaceae bacterium]
MSRRRTQQQGDAEISSDSFLDIIANIVGILIILIVVAGMRVSQAPIFQEPPSSDAEDIRVPESTFSEAPRIIVGTTDALLWSPSPAPQPEQIEPAEPVVINIVDNPDPELFAIHKRQTLECQKMSAEIVAIQSGLTDKQRSIADAEEELSLTRARLGSLNNQLREAKSKYETANFASNQKLKTTESRRQDAEQLVSLIERADAEHQKLAKSAPPDAAVLRHDMTPVSSFVQDDEIHFLVSKDSVTQVPLDAFLKQLKSRIQSKQSWLLRANSHTGEIGPLNGFMMKYMVEKEQQSHFDQLRTGSTQIRIVLSQFAMIPDEKTIIRETVSQATSSTSRFLIAIRSAPPGTTCTFWVHPDSFETYQKLKTFAHESNLQVAGRPLPQGMPITGSPSGSRSAAQ